MQCVKCVQNKLKMGRFDTNVREAITIQDGQSVCEFHVQYVSDEQEQFQRDCERIRARHHRIMESSNPSDY